MKRLIPFFLTILLFLTIIFSRVVFFEADAPRISGVSEFMINIEEKNSGYNAREKVFFGEWKTDSGWYQSMVYMPLSNLFIYLSFLKFGVGLWQSRLPFMLLSLIGILFFYKILLRETNFWVALLTIALYSFNFNITFWNRSSLNENLYLFFIPLTLFYYLKINKDIRYVFLFSLFSFLVFIVKVSSLPFILATIIMFAFYLYQALRKDKDFLRFKKAIGFFSLGIVFVFLIWLALMSFTGSFKLLSDVYQYYSTQYLFNQVDSLSSLFLLFWENVTQVIRMFIFINPYFVFLVVLALLHIIINYKKITKLQLFCLLIVGIWLVQICFYPKHRVGAFKRYIYIMLPLYCLIGTTFYQLKKGFKRPVILHKLKLFFTVTASFLLSWVILAKGYQPFEKIFSKNLGNIWIFGILSLVFLGALVMNNLLKKKLSKNIVLVIYGFFLILCFNFDMRAIIKYLQNPKYRYLTSSKQFAEDIDLEEKVIGHEQTFRVLGFANKVRFIFTSDGYLANNFLEKVLDNEKARYFVLMVKQHIDEPPDGYVREKVLQIKDKYPDVKLLKIYHPDLYDALALYDKYPEKDSPQIKLDESEESKWKFLIAQKALNPGFRYYSFVLDWSEATIIRYPYGVFYEDVEIIQNDSKEMVLAIKVHGKLTEGELKLWDQRRDLPNTVEISSNGLDWTPLGEIKRETSGYYLGISEKAEKIFLRLRNSQEGSNDAFKDKFELWYLAESSDELPVKVDFFDKVSAKVNLSGQKKDFLYLRLSGIQEKIKKITITSGDRIWVGPPDGTNPQINFIEEEDRADFAFNPLGINNLEKRVFKIKIWYRNIYNQRQWTELLLGEKQEL